MAGLMVHHCVEVIDTAQGLATGDGVDNAETNEDDQLRDQHCTKDRSS